MGARDDKQLEAARSLIRDLADRLDLNAWARLWDGTRLPLGKAPTSNFEIAISDPGVIGAILRSPRLDTIIRQYVEKGIDFSGGTLVDFGSGLQKGKTSG
jgi:cyclopropane-fatty-acyl-phospholipid synthase